ncbi:hypothetical protein EKO04_008761 [Ascochyta lentis]|uniref:Uncharacterized protein n=1 Tax=Ascochyta lentis TaxID=205686 RepID=A0A8H7J1C7_9PLEO|nr:hypothetical protein EKO04_008761 [Ascochyta lentis]
MTDQPNFQSEAALAFEREYDTKRAHLDAKLARKGSQITHHESELKKLEDLAAARRKPSKELERSITATRNTIKEVRKEYAAAVVDFYTWTKCKHDEVGRQIERAVEERLEKVDVKLKSLKYEDITVEADE